MISVAEARSRILAGVEPLPAEWVMLSEAHGRVLAADALSRRTQPPLAVSAMDGYAVRGEDVRSAPATLRQVGAVAAGQVYRGSVGPGEAVRIFTGAPLPDGADTVVIQENVRAEDAAITVLEPTGPGRHVRRAGIDFREGEVGLPAGRRLTARDIGLAAGMNLPWLPVRRRPRVAILATGDEIVLPGEPLAEGQIIGSSGPALAAFIRSCGGLPVSLGVARDRREEIVGGPYHEIRAAGRCVEIRVEREAGRDERIAAHGHDRRAAVVRGLDPVRDVAVVEVVREDDGRGRCGGRRRCEHSGCEGDAEGAEGRQ